MMNSYRCPICHLASCHIKFHYRAESPVFMKKHIVECDNCGALSTFPLPSDNELKEYYGNYWKSDNIDVPMFVSQAEARYEFLQPFLPYGESISVLDIGAGFGLIQKAFAKRMVDCRLQYDAVEVNSTAVDYLRKEIGPRKIFSSIDECTEKYKVIICSHIIEHLKDPVRFLIEQKTRLIDKGLLFIEVPNQDFGYKTRNEPHLMFFSPETLASAVRRAGYTISRLDTCGPTLESMKKAQSLQNLKQLVKKILPERVLRNIQNAKRKRSMTILNQCLYVYGANRRWIRLVALKH